MVKLSSAASLNWGRSQNGVKEWVKMRDLMTCLVQQTAAKPHSSVGRVADLRTGSRWFDPGSANILSED